MARLVARIKILPADVNVNLEVLVNALGSVVPPEMELKSSMKEPIAFGLEAVIAEFTLEDNEGQMDLLEESIKKVHGVGQIDVINVSRQSVRIG